VIEADCTEQLKRDLNPGDGIDNVASVSHMQSWKLWLSSPSEVAL